LTPVRKNWIQKYPPAMSAMVPGADCAHLFFNSNSVRNLVKHSTSDLGDQPNTVCGRRFRESVDLVRREEA
jgi:hypothetical protein